MGESVWDRANEWWPFHVIVVRIDRDGLRGVSTHFVLAVCEVVHACGVVDICRTFGIISQLKSATRSGLEPFHVVRIDRDGLRGVKLTLVEISYS